MSVFEEVCTITKLKPKAEEPYKDFAWRLVRKIKDLSDDDWESLSKAAQDWNNETVTKLNSEDDELPELEGYGSDAEEAEASEESTDGGEEEATPPPKSQKAPRKRKATAPAAPPPPKKEASKAPPKAAAPPKAKAAKKNAEEAARGRPGLFPTTATITILVQENPKRANSEAAKRFAKYKTGQTVAEALEAGVSWRDLRFDSEKKFISAK